MHRTGASSVARVLRLAPLTIEEAAQFVGSASASVLVRSIHAQSGGNPYFLEQLSRAVQLSPPSPTAVPNETDEVDVPDALRRAVGLELDRLSPGGLAVLQACSVIGGPFDVDLLAEITRLDRTAVLTFVDELVTHDLLEATAEAKSLRFRHPVVKRAVYDGLSPGKRIDAHWRVANWLADKGAPLVDRAHHIEHSAAFGDEAAVAALADAAHVVSAYAPATAVGWYRAALKLLPDTAGTDRRLPLELSLAGALASAGLLHDSRVALDRMLTRLPRIASDRLPIIRMIARAEHGLGRSENARQLLLDALGHVPVGSTEFVPLQLALAENNLMTRRWNRAIDAARQAITEATAMGDPSVLLSATSRLAWCTGYAAATTEARSLIDTATMQLNALEAQADPRLLEALGDLVNAEIAVDRFRIADTHVQRGLRLAHDSGQRYAFGYFALGAVATKLFVGNLQGARAAAAGAIEAARSLDNDQLLVAAQSLRCWNEIQLGNISVALSAGRSAVEIAERTRGGLFSWLAHVCYGDALIESGEFARGRQEIISACGAELVHIPPAARPIWQFALVTAELALGVRSVAIARTRQMEATAGVSFSRRGYAHLCRSRIQLAEGNPVAAAASALRAVDCFDEADMRLWSARARLVCGQAHARAGSMAEAVRELEIAHGVLHEAAATRLRDEAARELRALGQRVRPGRPTVGAAVSSHCRLSARERGIADLVSQGLTNRQIADQLFISAKTVEKHLARVFTKLGVSTRAAVAAAVSQQRAEDG
ncbi:LuxR C-terminal-related transcriptional regulator [Nocardia sp. NPDC051900]|uniref:helix-turn-helix transcriptional regulator n=1 Tax=Nocardia sp. NPDC051900 TaxID=3364326 RepID=UPI003790C9CF